MVQLLSFGLAVVATLALTSSVDAAAVGKTCVVANSKTDDSLSIIQAFKDCQSGGTVVFPKGNTYNIKSIIKIEKLKNVYIDFQSKVNLPRFDKKFKGESAFITLKGDNVNMSGGGSFNGNGQTWWDAKDVTAPTVLRVTLKNSQLGNFKILNSPRAHMGVTSCQNLVLHNLYFKSASINSNRPMNTDALQISSTTKLLLKDSELIVGDDCTAINGGNTDITVSNVKCVGGHGFSIGSLGKNGSTENVKDVTIINSECSNCQNGVRIKTWSGGKGVVSNVKFQNIKLPNNENPIIVTAHYCDKNQMNFCTKNANKSLDISGITFTNISGSASSAKKNPIVNFDCAKDTPCSGFSVSGINIQGHSRTPKNVCNNVRDSGKLSVCK
ncbi:hypothetical protein MFLAVUS_003448 [Mucor flavus]|uniref:Uncharacterized protein n=1 Tax=Mucor flavus TaxID=439312 RepID=A0ABP9YT44_9FUNG